MSTGNLSRLESLDQFRGYTVAGMFLVNFVGSFQAAPYLMKHHLVFCSYADTIMPQFFFAVGFALRLSVCRRKDSHGVGAAYWHAVKRCLGLALIAIIWYGGRPKLPNNANFDWETICSLGVWGCLWKQAKVDWFQTLLHIAVASLWILPVIRRSKRWRIGYLVLSGALHFGLNYWFYFQWHNGAFKGIDGGPLGFLTWSIPTLVGTLCYDLIHDYQFDQRSNSQVIIRLLFWSIFLSAVGWAMSCGTRCYDLAADANPDEEARLPILSQDPVIPPRDALALWWTELRASNWNRALAEPPFVPPPHARDEVQEGEKTQVRDLSSRYRPWNYWMMSQQCGSISYLVFSSGISLFVYLIFFVLAEIWSFKIGVFRTMGVNALLGYFLHSIVDRAVKNFMPADIPAIPMWIGFAIYFGICWLMLKYLEKNKIFLRL